MDTIIKNFADLPAREITKILKNWAGHSWSKGERGKAPAGSNPMITRRFMTPDEVAILNEAVKAKYDEIVATLPKKQSELRKIEYKHFLVDVNLPSSFVMKYDYLRIYNVIKRRILANGHQHFEVIPFDELYLKPANSHCGKYDYLPKIRLAWVEEKNTYQVDEYFYPKSEEVAFTRKNWPKTRAKNDYIKSVKATYDEIIKAGYQPPIFIRNTAPAYEWSETMGDYGRDARLLFVERA